MFFFYSFGEEVTEVPTLSETFEEWIGATSLDTLFTTATANEDFEFGNWDETMASPIPSTGVDSFTTATANEDFEFGNWDETVSPIVLAGTGVDETFDSGWSGI